MRLFDLFKNKKRSDTVIYRKGDNIIIGQPAKYPDILVKAIVSFCKNRKDVEAVYLAQIYNLSSTEPQHLIIGIKSTNKSEALLRDMYFVIKNFYSKKDFIDFLFIGND